MLDVRTADRIQRSRALRERIRSASVSGQLVLDGIAPVERHVADVAAVVAEPERPARSGGRGHEPVSITVLGVPAPKGSAQAFYNKRTQRAHVVPGGAKSTRERMKSWDAAVREAALAVVGDRAAPVFVQQPLEVSLVFKLGRLTGHYGTGKHAGQLKPSAPIAPAGKPDVDKLARATLDAMTGSVFDDDSRIVSLRCLKVYTTPGHEGADIVVSAWGIDHRDMKPDMKPSNIQEER